MLWVGVPRPNILGRVVLIITKTLHATLEEKIVAFDVYPKTRATKDTNTDTNTHIKSKRLLRSVGHHRIRKGETNRWKRVRTASELGRCGFVLPPQIADLLPDCRL